MIRAFKSSTVSYANSVMALRKLLLANGVREIQTNERGTDDEGELALSFIHGEDPERRGVRIRVQYKVQRGPKGGQAGSDQRMAARALFWFLKAKFDSIEYGLESFDVAFMPHLITESRTTFAEAPHLIETLLMEPEIGLLPLLTEGD